MSQLSKILKNHVSRLDISIQALSKSSGVDRSFIHHILTGKRIPADKDVLENIMKALTLTPTQSEELRRLYYIERIGECIFRRNVLVKNLLESLVGLDTTLPPIKSSYQHDFTSFPQSSAFSGTQNINTVIKAVLEEESTRANGYVKLIVQPEYRFLMDLLLTIGNMDSLLKIEHVFCLQKDIREKNENTYNLKALQAVMPLLLSCCCYEAYIYYDNIDSSLNVTSVFPYIIITSDKVIGISYDLQHATLFLDHSFHEVYSQVYQRIFRSCSPLTSRILDPMDFYMQHSVLELGVNDPKGGNSFTYSLFAQPCLVFFVNRELLNKYVVDFPQKEEVIDLMLKRSTYYCQKLLEGYEYTTFFTSEGLDSFWNTGRITEIPDEFYHPIDKEDCLALLKILYDSILHTSYNACILNPYKLRITDRLVISAVDESSIFFMYVHPTRGMFHFVFHEPSISMSIFNFLNFLKESELVFNRDETLAILHSKIKEYENELALLKKMPDSMT